MSTFRSARVLVLIVALGALALASGCSKTPDGETAGTTPPATTPAAPRADAASAGGAKASCDPAVLVPVIQQKWGQAGVDHLVCLVPFAILTVKTGGDDTVAFLVQRDGAWAVGADGPVPSADSLLPPSFPSSLVRSWQDKRSSPTTTAAPSPPKQGRSSTTQPCGPANGDLTCAPTTTDAPAVTTPKPTTTRAPVTEPPVTTAAPPTTFSQFCLEHPLDPSCSGKK